MLENTNAVFVENLRVQVNKRNAYSFQYSAVYYFWYTK